MISFTLQWELAYFYGMAVQCFFVAENWAIKINIMIEIETDRDFLCFLFYYIEIITVHI